MQLEFILCGSPTDAFWSQVTMFRRSLDSFGGVYSDARVAFYYGAPSPVQLPNRWRPHFQKIEINTAPAHEWLSQDDWAQANNFFRLLSDHADLSFICDADTLLVRPFPTEFLEELVASPAICGVIAPYPLPTTQDEPLPAAHLGAILPDEISHEGLWDLLADYVLGHKIRLDYGYTLTNAGQACCPFYINYGFVAGTPDLLKRLYGQLLTVQPRILRVLSNRFYGQVGVALGVERGNLPRRVLPMRFNFPNGWMADAAYPTELDNVILIHYFNTDLFDRHKIFADPESFADFMNAKLEGSNKVLQTHIAHLTGGEYPFP